MIETITNTLTKLAEFFSSVWEFLKTLFNDTIALVKMLKEWVAQIPDLFDWLPSGMLSLVVLGIGIVVLYKILGREG